jgi:hypothetical protein
MSTYLISKFKVKKNDKNPVPNEKYFNPARDKVINRDQELSKICIFE